MSEFILRATPERLSSIYNLLNVMYTQAMEGKDKGKEDLQVARPTGRILQRIRVARSVGVQPSGYHEVYLLKSDANFLKELSEMLNLEGMDPIEVYNK